MDDIDAVKHFRALRTRQRLIESLSRPNPAASRRDEIAQTPRKRSKRICPIHFVSQLKNDEEKISIENGRRVKLVFFGPLVSRPK